MSDISRVLISAEELDRITTRVAAEIDRDYKDVEGRIVLVCVLKGSIVFMGDLMKKLTVPVEIECVRISSYGSGTTSGGRINLLLDVDRADIGECNLIVVEDIIDSGLTLTFLVKHLIDKGAKSVRTVTLLDKPSRRKVDFKTDYVGKEIPDEFVIGYGLDYDERYRELPYVGILDPSVYS
ncbi:MAG: hypoxanthine phosphoribosyltransferase [Clostridia bacterium]|nr:hypoxanthine phosphoribosyltransferase [Clostridia bacterium]